MIDETLVDILTKTVKDLHRSKVFSLAKKLEKISVDDISSISLDDLVQGISKDTSQALKAASEKSGLSSRELAVALEVAASIMHVSEEDEQLELVWSGPATKLVPSRRTEQVMVETILSAKENVFLMSYVFYGVSLVSEALKKVIESGVRVEVLLESSMEKGGKVDVDSHAKIKRVLPDAIVYAAVVDEEFDGAVHVKCILADDHTLFVTSANLTKAAMDRNMELGVKISGGDNPKKLEGHIKLLKASGRIKRVE